MTGADPNEALQPESARPGYTAAEYAQAISTQSTQAAQTGLAQTRSIQAESAVSFQNVHKIYARSHLGWVYTSRGVQDLSFQLRPGEIFGLLGLNGSGKTTTMKLALGLLVATSGDVSIFGRPAGSREALGLMGYLPELPYFYPHLNPEEVLAFYGRLSGLIGSILAERIRHVLHTVNLEKHSKRRMGEFSKGMLQRVGMAQALLHDPKLLILDEPVSGLDPLAIADFRSLFTRLNKEGKTLLLSSHSISEVERLCHRVGVLVEGRMARVLDQAQWVRESGKLEDLFVETVQAA